MGSFVKKTFTGYKEVAGGYSDPEAEYYIETIKEYQADAAKIRKAEEAVYQAQRDADEKVKQAYESARRQLKQYLEETDQKAAVSIKAAQEAQKLAENRLQEAEAELKRQKYLNGNLKRIARERANQNRDIRPKKEHDGYLVMSSRQWVENYEYTYTDEEYNALNYQIRKKHPQPYIERRKADVWKSVIQTPYDASLPLDQIRGQVEGEIGGVLESIGCQSRLKSEYNGVFYDFGMNDEGYPKNGMYKWKYQANYKVGFWELEIYTTKSLRVPENRRPKPVGRKSGKKKDA